MNDFLPDSAVLILLVLRELILDEPETMAVVYGIDVDNPDPAPLDRAISAWRRSGCPVPDLSRGLVLCNACRLGTPSCTACGGRGVLIKADP